jgi:hypothetical protein
LQIQKVIVRQVHRPRHIDWSTVRRFPRCEPGADPINGFYVGKPALQGHCSRDRDAAGRSFRWISRVPFIVTLRPIEQL